MRTRYLKTFVTVAQGIPYAKAADRLGLTESAVSVQIRTLERQLGRVLFDRSQRPPVLNAYGRAVLERAQEILSLYDEMIDSVGSDQVSGEFNVGVVPTSLTGMMPLALQVYQRRYPNVHIHLVTGFSADLIKRLQGNELDAAVISDPVALPSTILWRPVAREPLEVIAPQNTVGGTDREILEALPYIRFSRRGWVGQLIERHLRQRNILVREVMELDTLEAVTLMVSQGNGASVVPRRGMKSPFEVPLTHIPFGETPIYRTMGLCAPKSHPKRRLIEGFHEALVRTTGGPGSREDLAAEASLDEAG